MSHELPTGQSEYKSLADSLMLGKQSGISVPKKLRPEGIDLQ